MNLDDIKEVMYMIGQLEWAVTRHTKHEGRMEIERNTAEGVTPFTMRRIHEAAVDMRGIRLGIEAHLNDIMNRDTKKGAE